MTRRNNESFLAILLAVILGAGSSGCGGGSASSQMQPPPLTVSMSPTTATVQEGLTQKLTATVNNDPTNQGVTWTVSCGIASGCGSLSAMSSLSGAPVTYTAFSNTVLNNSATVTVTATSVADTRKSAVAAVTIPIQPGVGVLPVMGLTHVNADMSIVAEKGSTDGLTWSLAGCTGGASACGSLSLGSTQGDCGYCYNLYTAPAAVPPGGQVSVVATSTTDPTISATATVVVSPINFAPTNYPAGNAPYDVVVADFNGDGKLDLAVADNGNYLTGDKGGVSILLGNGDGTFQPAQLVNAGNNPIFLAAGDFNGDGKTDLVVSGLGALPSGGNGNLTILLGRGDGTFQSPITLSAGLNPSAMALGDFNGDGKLDIAVLDFGNFFGNNGAMYILLGNGDGTFQPPVLLNAGSGPAAIPVAIVAGDFNGDGKLDLTVVSSDFNIPATSNVGILLGNGDGTFQTPIFYGIPQIPTSLAAGDLKGNGKIDLAVASFVLNPGLPQAGSSIQVLSGNGDGTFQGPQDVSLIYAYGAPNLTSNFSVCSAEGVSIWKGIGICLPLSLHVADVDGSGKTSLVGIGGVPVPSGGGVFVLPGNGDGSFEGLLGYPIAFEGFWPTPGGTGAGLAVADFNGDGKLDIVSTFLGDTNNAANVTVLLNDTVPYGAKTHAKRKSNVTSRK
jgi:hypothetical protein